MKLHCSREEMLSALQLVSAAVPGRDQRPVLQNVKLTAADDRCTLAATDLEVGIRREVSGVPTNDPGEVLLPANRTIAIFRESPDEQLAIETDAQTTTLRGAATEFELAGEDVSSFPDIPTVNGEAYHEIGAGALKTMIHRTVFAAATESPRYAMIGTLWELDGNNIRLVATDGRRLAVAESPATQHGDHATKNATHIVPTKAMQLLERNLPALDQSVSVRLQPNDVTFETGSATIYSRLVEGRYPAYKDVFPKKSSTKISLTVGPLHTAIRQASIMVDTDTRRLLLQFGKNKLLLKAQGAEAGRSQVQLAIAYDGRAIDIAFDPRLLTDMLRALDPIDELTLEMTDGKSPALFRSGDKYSYLVMPLY